MGTGAGQSEEVSCPNTTNDISVMPLRLQAREKNKAAPPFSRQPGHLVYDYQDPWLSVPASRWVWLLQDETIFTNGFLSVKIYFKYIKIKST
jgi:hypothetical protein